MQKSIIILLLSILFTVSIGWAADKKKQTKSTSYQSQILSPIVENNWKYHKIGTLWTRVTNFGKTGDDAYEGRTPSGDWPGGSGNSYLYRGSPWLAAKVDGVIHVTEPEDSEFSSIDSVHLYIGDQATRGEQETYTRYYDVYTPQAAGHFPLGLEVIERTYAWSESYRDDFIIYEFTIKNVGIDTDGDGEPDTPRDLEEFYFTYRLDGDVSKKSDWEAEMPYSNEDDLAGVNSSWDFIDIIPQWAGVDKSLLPEPDTTIVFMFDADNPSVPSEYEISPGVFLDDDMGNPGVDGTLQTPGVLGIKICKTEPASFKVSKFRTGHIYNDPDTDQQAYERFMVEVPSEDPYEEQGPSGVPIVGGEVYPYDYRGYLTLGPMETFAAGDSVVITMALGVGVNPDSGGFYSLVELANIMNIAQLVVDNDYELVSLSPPSPSVAVATTHNANGLTEGVKVIWDREAENHENFRAYKVSRSLEKDLSGAQIWEELAYYDSEDPGSWPPTTDTESGGYQFVDPDVVNGFDIAYSVQSISIELPEPFGVQESNILTSLRVISPANAPATSLDRVRVVPNPYVGSALWNNPVPSNVDPWEHRLQFINLPADATIKIYTLDGDFVDEVRAGQGVRQSESFGSETASSVAEWDLITRNNQDAAPGIYLYVVQSPSAGEKIDKFVIVR
jgi:hypothetical protein